MHVLFQTLPASATQQSASQTHKLFQRHAWLAKGVPDVTQALQRSRMLFNWAAALGKVVPTSSPLAHFTVGTLLVQATQTAAAFLGAAASLRKLESVGVLLPGLSDGSGGGGSSSVTAVTAAAIDLQSVVTAALAGYTEPQQHMPAGQCRATTPDPQPPRQQPPPAPHKPGAAPRMIPDVQPIRQGQPPPPPQKRTHKRGGTAVLPQAAPAKHSVCSDVPRAQVAAVPMLCVC